jgi:hypothetical protein
LGKYKLEPYGVIAKYISGERLKGKGKERGREGLPEMIVEFDTVPRSSQGLFI